MAKTETGMGKTNTQILEEGGPAFPHLHSDSFGVPSGWEGLTVRDWFAGQAIASMVPGDTAKQRAEFAYQIADAMLAERNKR